MCVEGRQQARMGHRCAIAPPGERDGDADRISTAEAFDTFLISTTPAP